jgi:adenylyltransferase/sulfurtransferase
LELRIETWRQIVTSQLPFLCQRHPQPTGGARFAAVRYTQVVNVKGGFNGWRKTGYPFSIPRVLTDDQRQRYSRHTIMPEVGEEGQLKLLDASVLLIGAGGLGSRPPFTWHAAGWQNHCGFRCGGYPAFTAPDYSPAGRCGYAQGEIGGQGDCRLNPDVKVVGHQTQLTSQNAYDIIGQYDIVINGSDNFPTRYLVKDACVLLGKKLVDASIFRFEGQVTVFDTASGGPCYRCLYPDPPPPGEVPSCAEGGVLGVLPGIVGSLEAVEAIKLILDAGDPLIGRLLLYDALATEFREVKVRKNADCPVCGTHPTVTQLIDYEQFCGISHAAAGGWK